MPSLEERDAKRRVKAGRHQAIERVCACVVIYRRVVLDAKAPRPRDISDREHTHNLGTVNQIGG